MPLVKGDFFLFEPFFFFKKGFLCVSLAVLELFVGQNSQVPAYFCLPECRD